jgi:hypothetical protein
VDQVGVRVDAMELKALHRMLEALENDHNISNFGEYFRDTEYERVFLSLEPVLFHLDEANLEKPQLEEEIRDGWKNLLVHAKNDADRRAQVSKQNMAAPANADVLRKVL